MIDIVRHPKMGPLSMLFQSMFGGTHNPAAASCCRGASEEIATLFFTNMSERAGKIMREDMEAMGAERLKKVNQAQAAIAAAAKTLADAGEIVIADGGEEDELIT